MLEPIAAYELLAREKLKVQVGEFLSYNIGPDDQSVKTVLELVDQVKKKWDLEVTNLGPGSAKFHEARLLSLDNTKIKHETSWRPRWSFAETVNTTLNWYKLFSEGNDALALCSQDIRKFKEGV